MVDRVQKFNDRFKTAMKRLPSGGIQLETVVLFSLVREEPDVAADVIRIYLESAVSARNRALFQRAFVLAEAYLAVTGDSGLLDQCKAAARQAQTGPVTIGVAPGEGPPRTLVHVSAAELKACDIKPVVLGCSIELADDARRRELAKMEGQCFFDFPSLAEDPRPLAHIPEARRWMAALHKAMPYVPFFLGGDEPIAIYMTYFACLAAEQALKLVNDGKHLLLGPEDAAFLAHLIESLAAIRGMTKLLAQDPAPSLARILSPVPAEMHPLLLEAAAQAEALMAKGKR